VTIRRCRRWNWIRGRTARILNGPLPALAFRLPQTSLRSLSSHTAIKAFIFSGRPWFRFHSKRSGFVIQRQTRAMPAGRTKASVPTLAVIRNIDLIRLTL
jgi:hypothetical protein